MYDTVIIGAGASGTALFYTLGHYSNIRKIALIEKYDRPGQVNTKASNNSQTLHVGDIETNYPIEKVEKVFPASMMVSWYTRSLQAPDAQKIISKVSKMVLAVGKNEVLILEKRYKDLLPIFPNIQKLDSKGIAKVEPKVVEGRNPNQPVLALYNEEGYAVNFEELAKSFVEEGLKHNKESRVMFNSKVEKITKSKAGTYELVLNTGEVIKAKTVVVDADSYSLLIAKQLGYGKQYSLIPIAGTFYFSKELLKGKVYTVQEPKLPFAAVHGDPDMNKPGFTRWGPTARFHPVLESSNFKTSIDYVRSSGLSRPRTWIAFTKILLDPIRLKYLLKNMLYELPVVGKHMFIVNAQKIVPTIRARDVRVAKGFGGMRLQRVDINTHELQLGEGKIIGENIIFNMTPSPGASVCLFNALRDAEVVASFLGLGYLFDKRRMEEDLVINHKLPSTNPVSLPEGYAS